MVWFIFVAYVALLLFSTVGYTQEQEEWFCTKAASTRSGQLVRACGIGEAPSESQARENAFNEALNEFKRVCGRQSDCFNRVTRTTPMRTECRPHKNNVRCYRLVEFDILNETIILMPDQVSDEKLKKVNNKIHAVEGAITQISVKHYPKIRKGMKMSDVIAIFGEPEEVGRVEDIHYRYHEPPSRAFASGYMAAVYDNRNICSSEMFCLVYYYKGRVIGEYNFNFRFTTALEE